MAAPIISLPNNFDSKSLWLFARIENTMDQPMTLTDHKLFRALMQFKRLGWHQHSIAGCTPSEIRVLICIKRGGGTLLPQMTVSEISKHLSVTPPSITQILNTLEARGLLERHMDTADRRVIMVNLTKQGEQVTEQADEAFSATMKGLIDYLGEQQSSQLADLLFKVFRYFAESDAQMNREAWEGEKVE
jgi:DNA-binding MarR family transcriptional regulator